SRNAQTKMLARLVYAKQLQDCLFPGRGLVARQCHRWHAERGWTEPRRGHRHLQRDRHRGTDLEIRTGEVGRRERRQSVWQLQTCRSTGDDRDWLMSGLLDWRGSNDRG